MSSTVPGTIQPEDPLEFERQYAESRGFTVEQLRSYGRVVAPCNCSEAGIEGLHWQSIQRDIMEDYQQWGRVPKDWVWPPE